MRNPGILKRGQESVWDYPRPPRLEDFAGHIQIIFNRKIIAETDASKRVLETSHPPVYYIPPGDIEMGHLRPSTHYSWCEWKGKAFYYDIQVGEKISKNCAWYYPDPVQAFLAIQNYVAFYAGSMGACYVNGEKAVPQPGGFYGGWITGNIIGPFKGEPGTQGW